MTLSKRLRFEIFKRDSFVCRYCGQKPPAVILHVDHILARANGGSDDSANLVTSCSACNQGKSAVPLGTVLPHIDEIEILSAIQDLAERKMLLGQQVAMANAQREVEVAAIEAVCGWILDDLGVNRWAIADRSVETFLRRLGVEGVREAVNVASAHSDHLDTGQVARWKYFCGVCWKKIRMLEEGTE